MGMFGDVVQGFSGFLEAKHADRAASQARRAFGMSAEERAAIRANFAAETRDVARREAELVELSKALVAAGGNLHGLLTGQEASILGPLRDSLARDESALRKRLRDQLGPGYETSTAGSQALNEFFRQRQLTLEQAQQSSISQMAGIAQGPRRGVIDPNMANLMNSSLAGRSAAAEMAATSEIGNIMRSQALGNFGKALSREEASGERLLGTIFGGGGGGGQQFASAGQGLYSGTGAGTAGGAAGAGNTASLAKFAAFA